MDYSFWLQITLFVYQNYYFWWDRVGSTVMAADALAPCVTRASAHSAAVLLTIFSSNILALALAMKILQFCTKPSVLFCMRDDFFYHDISVLRNDINANFFFCFLKKLILEGLKYTAGNINNPICWTAFSEWRLRIESTLRSNMYYSICSEYHAKMRCFSFPLQDYMDIMLLRGFTFYLL